MKVNSIQILNFSNRYNCKNDATNRPMKFRKNNLVQDCFEKPSFTNINFKGVVKCANYQFEHSFPKSFFKKLLREGVSDAYSKIQLIPREAYDEIRKLGALKKKSSCAIRALRPYKENMFELEKRVFAMLELLSKKHPNLTLQELLKLKFPKAEEILIRQQSNILNKMNLMVRSLPRKEYNQLRVFIQATFNKIFDQDPAPEDRFGRKKFIKELKQFKISDEELKKKLYKLAEKLPQSSNSINAFIVKYSQPYKLKYNSKTDTYKKVKRDSQEIGLRLLEPSLGTDDHIHSQFAFREEELARQNGDAKAQNLSKLRVTVLASKKYNELKTDTPLDNFITETNLEITDYIQNHVDELTDIALKWAGCGRLKDAVQLCDYIMVLKNEFESRSNLVKIDLKGFEEKILKIKQKAQASESKKSGKVKKINY